MRSRPMTAASAWDRRLWLRSRNSKAASPRESARLRQHMHELSIAMSIVELAEEEAVRRGVQVEAVHLKLGALSGVVKEALLSCYDMVCEGTALQGSRLVVEDVPVV